MSVAVESRAYDVWLRVVRRRYDDQAAAASDGPDPEPEEAERDLRGNHRRPAVKRPEEGRGCRADCAADEVARHERRVDPAAGLLGDSEDPRLVEDVECLNRDIHEDDHHDEDGDRVPREDRDDERDKGQRPRRPGGRERPAAVVETPGSLRGDHTDEPDEPEEPDHGHVVGERRGAEEECQRRPEHRERREGRRPQHHRPPKCPFPSDHGADGSEQCGVFHVRLRSERRNGAVDEDGKHNAGDRRGREDHAPTGCIGDQSAQGARDEDPGQDSRDDDADDAATAFDISEVTGERSENLPRHGRYSHHGDRDQEDPHRRCERAHGERGRGADHHRRNEMPTITNITQRDNQQGSPPRSRAESR